MTEQQVKSLRAILAYTAPEALEWKIGMLIDNAVVAEREACALTVEKLASADVVYPEGIRMIADAIRNRS